MTPSLIAEAPLVLGVHRESAPPVLVEVLFLRHLPSGALAWRRVVADLPARTHPDDLAGQLRGSAPPGAGDRFAHSTSWRYEEEGRIVLTYLAHPDPAPAAPAEVLTGRGGLARGASSERPAPESICGGQVAAHAARHLAFLRRTDPVVAAYVAGVPGLGAALAALPDALAGQVPGG